ncbi:hypothetical protein WBP06_09255 [Novosphingobium sp. BL-8H]|uniref:hypothetical protein n=1 Tax=Novosphingobium sp. BL-8H TaxID=3127640 RepID=UPI00375703AD
MKTFTVEVTQVVQAYTLHPVTEESTFEELRLTDVERDAIALDLENELGIRVCDKTARGWQSVGDILRTTREKYNHIVGNIKARDRMREAMA